MQYTQIKHYIIQKAVYMVPYSAMSLIFFLSLCVMHINMVSYESKMLNVVYWHFQ